MDKEKNVDKIIKSKVKKYKIKLFLESVFPIASGRMHSIPDVVGPFKLIFDVCTLASILIIMLDAMPLVGTIFSLFFPISSIAITIALYKIDFDPCVISKIERDVLESIARDELDNEAILEKQVSKNNKDDNISNTITNNTFDNKFERNTISNSNKPKVLVKRK